MKTTTLVKSQFKKFGAKLYTENGQLYRITAIVRYDDECGNGHNSFSITGQIDYKDGRWQDYAGGCIHDEIAKHFPEIAPLIKWHLCGSDGPMYYIENTTYHATQHGPNKAWVYFEDKANGIDRHCVKYTDIAHAQEICKTFNYSMEVDAKTAKEANLEHARSSAIWPEATQAQLLDKDALNARLPALMAEFQAAVESLGFTF